MRQRKAFERPHTHRTIASPGGAENAEILSTTDWLIAMPGEVTHASRRSAAPYPVHAHMGTPFRLVRRVSNFRCPACAATSASASTGVAGSSGQDPAAEQFPGDDPANRLRAMAYRAP
jgi:hypothetical protein